MKRNHFGQTVPTGPVNPLQASQQKLRNLQVQLSQMSAANNTRKGQLDAREAALRQGTVPVTGPIDVMTNLKNCLPSYLVPGNLGDVNKVIWPFWFTNQTPSLPPATDGVASQATANVTITQEAAFIVTAFMKSVFTIDTGTDAATYVDPLQPGASGLTPGLSMTIRDMQSSRVFMSNPIDLDTIGDGTEPTLLPTPLMFLPNSIIQTQLFNSNATLEYAPWITFLGVRCRIEDAQRIMSLITG